MRCKEWYGWHFPELSKIIQDNIAYCKAVKKIGKYLDSAIALSEWEKIIWVSLKKKLKTGFKTNTVSTELNDILPEDVEAKVKEAAEVSMGTEISDEDLTNIIHLCDQVGEMLFAPKLCFFVENNHDFWLRRFWKYPIIVISCMNTWKIVWWLLHRILLFWSVNWLVHVLLHMPVCTNFIRTCLYKALILIYVINMKARCWIWQNIHRQLCKYWVPKKHSFVQWKPNMTRQNTVSYIMPVWWVKVVQNIKEKCQECWQPRRPWQYALTLWVKM